MTCMRTWSSLWVFEKLDSTTDPLLTFDMDLASSSTSLPLSAPSHEGVQEDISHIMGYVDQPTPPPKPTFDPKGKRKADPIPSEDETSSVDSEDEVMGQLAG